MSVSTDRRRQTLCTGYYDTLSAYDIQPVLYNYIHDNNIPLEYLDELVVCRLRLERKTYSGTTPMECFGLADLSEKQCFQVMAICKEYVRERRNDSIRKVYGPKTAEKLIAEIEAQEQAK